MKTPNSNAIPRRWALGKAIFLVFIPMVFAAAGVAILKKGGCVEASEKQAKEAELRFSKITKHRDHFLKAIEASDKLFEKFQHLSMEYLNMVDSIDNRAILKKIKTQKDKVYTSLKKINESISDTLFNKVYTRSTNNYMSMINFYEEQVNFKKDLKICRADLKARRDMEELLNTIKLTEAEIDGRKKVLEVTSGNPDCKNLELKNIKLENKYNSAQARYENLNEHKISLKNGYNELINNAISKLDQMDFKVRPKKFKAEKDKIISDLKAGKLSLQSRYLANYN